MFSLHKCVAVAIILLALSVVSYASAELPAGASSTSPRFSVVWKERRFSVTAEQTSLSLVLGEIAKQTGLEIRGGQALEKEVSVSFSGVSLAEGLHQLLGPMNYVLLERKPSKAHPGAALLVISDNGTVKSGQTQATSTAGEAQPNNSETVAATTADDTAQLSDQQAAESMTSEQGNPSGGQAAQTQGVQGGVNAASPKSLPPSLPDEGVNLATTNQPAPATIPDQGTVIGSNRSGPLPILPDYGVNLEHQQSQSAQAQGGR
jgi:hypothetical protein